MIKERHTKYKTLDVTPLAGAMGGEIIGVDLSRPVKREVFRDIHRAWLDHSMIFFRNQDLSPAGLVRFARKWGAIHTHPFMPTMKGHPEILELIKNPSDKRNFGNLWHTDQSFVAKPAKATILHALETPLVGGDTMYSNMYLAYDALSCGLKKLLANIKVENTGNRNRRRGGQDKRDRYKGHSHVKPVSPPPEIDTISHHPIIRTHPETGRKGLYISSHTQGFADFDFEESLPMIEFLLEHIRRPEFTARLRWQPGTVAVWDNRCVMHYALNDYPGQRRCMRRITIKGDKPR